jgi:hypothetical protein
MAGVMGMAGELRSLICNLRRFVLVNVVIYDDLCRLMCYESKRTCSCGGNEFVMVNVL